MICTQLIIDIVDVYAIKSGIKTTTNSNGKPTVLNAIDLPSAKKKCSEMQDCLMFYDECGLGNAFRYNSLVGYEVASDKNSCNGKEDFLYVKGKKKSNGNRFNILLQKYTYVYPRLLHYSYYIIH